MAVQDASTTARRRAQDVLATVYPSTARPTIPWEARRAPPDYGQPAEPDWRGIDWAPFTLRTEVEGNEVTYIDLGEGDDPPIVFVHGIGGKWQNWLENLPRAAESRRAIALDLPGFGASPMPRQEISISFYAKLVDGLLEQLGVERAVIVGNSMGGFVATELAIHHSERVDRLVLASAAGISITRLRRRPIITGARVAGAISAFALARRHAMVARPRLRHLAMSFVIRHPSLMRPDLLLEIAPEANSPGFMDSMDALLGFDDKDRLPEIDRPVLLVWGREDMLVPVRDADEFERLLPRCRKVVLDETGHVPMLERPRSFNDCLMEFVEDPSPFAGEGRPDGDQPVSAPSAAEPTSRAYLASTPVR